MVILFGTPSEIFSKLSKECTKLYFEVDTEPYAIERDRKIISICEKEGVQIHKSSGHTLLKVQDLATAGEMSKNMGDFIKFMKK